MGKGHPPTLPLLQVTIFLSVKLCPSKTGPREALGVAQLLRVPLLVVWGRSAGRAAAVGEV